VTTPAGSTPAPIVDAAGTIPAGGVGRRLRWTLSAAMVLLAHLALTVATAPGAVAGDAGA
jgi:hypothetical protein